MTLPLSSRVCLRTALVALLGVWSALAYARGPQPASPPTAAKPARPQVRPMRPAPQKEVHLQRWMDNHSTLALPEQLHALENEPGFKSYPPETQQRMRDELVRLNNMTPQQRTRAVEGAEALERMNPQQRQQFNATVQQYRTLQPDRKRLVTKAFRDMREMPQAQRQAIINSDAFRAQFSDSERATLSNLLVWEPYFASRGANEAP